MTAVHQPVFVSAFYPLCDATRAEKILERYRLLSTFFNVHLCCPPSFTPTPPLPNTTLHPMAFEDLVTYKRMSKTTGLPRIRSESKDTKEFMILMNAKTEFIQRVRDAGVVGSHYIWLDAGIGQIFKEPTTSYRTLATLLASNTLPNDRIVIPGCLSEAEKRFDVLLTKVCWRFCGGFFIVPAEWVDLFADTVLAACEEIRWRSGLSIWEVNVWAFAESRLPIQWVRGDHNETIFTCLDALST